MYRELDDRPFEKAMKVRGFSGEFIAAANEKRRTQLRELAKEMLREQNDILAHRILRQRSVPEWVEGLIFEVAKSRGVSPLDIVQDRRSAEVVSARNQIVYEIKDMRPNLSFPHMGRWFGKHHTSLLYAVAKHSIDNNLPALTNYNVTVVQRRNAEISRKMRAQARQAAVMQQAMSG